MSFEDRAHESVDQAVRSLVQNVLSQATEERNTAVTAARDQAKAEAEQAAEARIADLTARHQAELTDAVAAARDEERTAASDEVRAQVDVAAQQRIADAITSVERRLGKIVAEAQAEAAEEMSKALAAVRARSRGHDVVGVGRLLESVRGLDGAASQAEVLDALALAVGREVERAAVFVARGERIQGWKMSGFGPRDSHPKSVDMNLGDAGVIGTAFSTARAINTRDGGSGPGFESITAERLGLAVPVVTGGRVVAIVYGDGAAGEGGDRPVPSGWFEIVEVLARHAGRCIEALAGLRAAEQSRQKVVA